MEPSNVLINEDQLSIPTSASAGTTQTVSVDVWNEAAFIGTGDEDFCDVSWDILDGVKISMDVRIDGGKVGTDTKCVRSSNHKTLSVPIQPWPEGNHLLTIDVYLTQSEQHVWSHEAQITGEGETGNGDGEPKSPLGIPAPVLLTMGIILFSGDDEQ